MTDAEALGAAKRLHARIYASLSADDLAKVAKFLQEQHLAAFRAGRTAPREIGPIIEESAREGVAKSWLAT